MSKEETFVKEVTGWFSPENIKTPFKERKQKAIETLCSRKCEYCNCEPVLWDATIKEKCVYLCLNHYKEKCQDSNPYLKLWFERQDKEKAFSFLPWREKRSII